MAITPTQDATILWNGKHLDGMLMISAIEGSDSIICNFINKCGDEFSAIMQVNFRAPFDDWFFPVIEKFDSLYLGGLVKMRNEYHITCH